MATGSESRGTKKGSKGKFRTPKLSDAQKLGNAAARTANSKTGKAKAASRDRRIARNLAKPIPF